MAKSSEVTEKGLLREIQLTGAESESEVTEEEGDPVDDDSDRLWRLRKSQDHTPGNRRLGRLKSGAL
jgi:hypothetical protein